MTQGGMGGMQGQMGPNGMRWTQGPMKSYGTGSYSYLGGISNWGMSPFWGGQGMMSPMMNSIGDLGGGIQGGGQGGGGGGGAGGGMSGGYQGAGVPPYPQQQALSAVLRASGVANDLGEVRWPIGLQILGGQGVDELRDQIDAMFQVAAAQSMSGPVNPELAQEMGRAVRKLRQLLLKDKTERFGMPRYVYDEAERFLNKMERAERILTAGLAAPDAGTQLRTNSQANAGSTPKKEAKPAPQNKPADEGNQANDGK
jgi:hypothetical protein